MYYGFSCNYFPSEGICNSEALEVVFASTFQKILNKAAEPSPTYHAFDSNCVRYIYDAARAGGLDVPAPVSSVVLTGILGYPGVIHKSAYTPAALGQALRQRRQNGDNRVTATHANQTPPNSKGPCN